MKKTFRYQMTLIAIISCLCFGGCGLSTSDVESTTTDYAADVTEFDEDNNEDGSDWLTTGDVFDYGTITRGGESIGVLVTINDEGASFYYDTPTRELFESVSYPFAITDSWDAYNDIFFDDANGDNESDVTLHFLHEDYSFTNFVWYWDKDNGYVYQEEVSFFRKPATYSGETDF